MSDSARHPKDDPPNRHRVEPSPEELERLILRYSQGRITEAEALARGMTGMYPNHGFAWMVLGVVLKMVGRNADALEPARKAAGLMPADADAHNNLAVILLDLGQPAEAEASARRALVINPDYGEAHTNLGNTLKVLHRLEEAQACYRRAVALKPGLAEAHNYLGVALKELGRLLEAEASCRRAIEIKPEFAEAHSNLLFCLHYLPRPPAAVFAEHQRWNAQQTKSLAPAPRPNPDRNPRRRRIGYVSPDLRQHSVAWFFAPLLQAHDRSEVEVFCYADVARPDAMTAHLEVLADRWLNTTGMSDHQLATRIVEDRIDVLVDLAGHTARNRLPVFARQPAPVQVSWLGYPNSTGLRAMNYRLVDEVTDPIGEADQLASEQLVRLGPGFLCYGAPTDAPAPLPPTTRAGEGITFGSFNNPAKLSPATLDTWSALLRRLPDARLRLKGRPFVEGTSRNAWLAAFQARGVDPARVTLTGRTASLTDHLSDYAQLDVALDPFPYNGTTTTCEALWMGVPVISLRGGCHAGRVGASLLTQIGRQEWIADSVDGYIRIAVDLAQDRHQREYWRQTLRARMQESSLCDAPGFARRIEAAYRTMWQRVWADDKGSHSTAGPSR